ncbi:MAG: PEP-CTERM sorting domain-containing protein [Sedimentisphaerales bacterium]|nr:PEP-CTERM sorting domain-containing protein [Sedimentisphaerales bacterium]
MPAYKWYYGCSPTAAASIIGYWDLNGYPNLFDAQGWDEIRLTENVKDQISSPEHNARYNPRPDDLTQPDSHNCIADWFRTSADFRDIGVSSYEYADDAFEGYADYRGYLFDAYYEPMYEGYDFVESFTWMDLVNEINIGNPMMFCVDTTGNGHADHSVSVLGYDDRGEDGLWYGCYTTWSEDETVVWQQFRPVSENYTWGVRFGHFVHPIPEPATLLFLSLGALALRKHSN